MLRLIQATENEHSQAVQEIFSEYLEWGDEQSTRVLGVSFDVASIIKHDMETLHIFMPPLGCLLLAYEDDALAGCACMRTIGHKMAEIKRMYVRPSYRNKGIGRALVDKIITQAHMGGYSVLRLDSARFMTAAHALYRSFGFKEIAPYTESEIPEEYRVHWLFMELSLQSDELQAQTEASLTRPISSVSNQQ